MFFKSQFTSSPFFNFHRTLFAGHTEEQHGEYSLLVFPRPYIVCGLHKAALEALASCPVSLTVSACPSRTLYCSQLCYCLLSHSLVIISYCMQHQWGISIKYQHLHTLKQLPLTSNNLMQVTCNVTALMISICTYSSYDDDDSICNLTPAHQEWSSVAHGITALHQHDCGGKTRHALMSIYPCASFTVSENSVLFSDATVPASVQPFPRGEDGSQPVCWQRSEAHGQVRRFLEIDTWGVNYLMCSTGLKPEAPRKALFNVGLGDDRNTVSLEVEPCGYISPVCVFSWTASDVLHCD